ncbi:MAG TPA: ArsR family transcriptional regulator [Fusobacteriaceae bacterium]|nr:ArsR family transcriptional regulator [Fusobacteriaceae bacterium]
MTIEKATLLLKMMSNPIRLGILRELILREEICVGNLEEILNVSQSSASQHLAHLRNSGIVNSRKNGKKVCYKVSEESVKEILKILDIS